MTAWKRCSFTNFHKEYEMDKNSSLNKPCTYCGNTALAGTYPPVCQEHLNVKTASKGKPKTLKELEVNEPEDPAPHA